MTLLLVSPNTPNVANKRSTIVTSPNVMPSRAMINEALARRLALTKSPSLETRDPNTANKYNIILLSIKLLILLSIRLLILLSIRLLICHNQRNLIK